MKAYKVIIGILIVLILAGLAYWIFQAARKQKIIADIIKKIGESETGIELTPAQKEKTKKLLEKQKIEDLKKINENLDNLSLIAEFRP